MPRSKEDFKQLKDERENSILKAALKLFATKGYASVSIDDITKSVKCSHGLFYHYFYSKESLYLKLMEHIKERFYEEYKDFKFNDDPKVAILDIITMHLDLIKRDGDWPYIIYLILTAKLENKDSLTKKRIVEESSKENIYTIVEKGQKEGVIYPYNIKELMIAYFALIKGLAYNRISLGYKNFKCPDPKIIANMFIVGGIK